MRILYLSPSGVLGGAEKVLLTVLAAVRRAYPSAQLSLLAMSEGPLLERASRIGVQTLVHRLPSELARLGDSQLRAPGNGRSIWSLVGQGLAALPVGGRFLRQLKRTIASLAPDVIHSNGIKTHCLLPWVRSSASILWHMHDFAGARPVARRLLSWARGKVSGVITVSEAVAANLRTLWPDARIWVIPNAVDVEEFSPGVQDGAWLDQWAGLPPPPPGTLRIGLPATYARWKGQAVFLQAIARYLDARACPPARFYLIGGPIYRTQGSQFRRAELMELARREGVQDHVVFVDFQENVVSAYRELDIVVHASTQPEPFGMTIIEAMACGKPVIAAHAGGAAEIFQSGHDALGTPPGNVQALADSLLLLAKDRCFRERLGVQARLTVCRRFNQDRLSRQICEVYEQLRQPCDHLA